MRIKGQENAYKEVIKTAVGGAAGVIHMVDSPTTDCQPNDNVEALRVFMLEKKVEARPVWNRRQAERNQACLNCRGAKEEKPEGLNPMHKQPVYAGCPAYLNGVSEAVFKVGMCLPAGPWVSDEDVRYIVDCIKEAVV